MSYLFICGHSDWYYALPVVQKMAAAVPSFEELGVRSCEHNCGTLYRFDGLSARELKEKLDFSAVSQADVMLFDSVPNFNKPGIVCLDMDMTTVEIEGIDEIARKLGVYREVADITAKAMRGGLDFAESLKRRVAMFRGGDASVLEDVKDIMQENWGLGPLLNETRQCGWYRGICSGGFKQLISVIDSKYDLDLVRANSLEIKNGRFTGELEGEIVDAEAKRQGVAELKRKHGIPAEQVIVLGDGANDLKMMSEAGVAIAYHAKSKVREACEHHLDHCDLGAVVVLLKLAASKIYGQG